MRHGPVRGVSFRWKDLYSGHPISRTLETPRTVCLMTPTPQCPGKGLSQFLSRVSAFPSTILLATQGRAYDRTDLASQDADSAFR